MSSPSVADRYAPWIIRAFFLGYLLLGLWIAPDYGVSWDEPIQRRHGLVATDYINRFFGIDAEPHAPEFEFETYEYRHYGQLFTVTCFALERWLGLETFREQHLLRHYAVFLVFWSGAIAFFLLLKFRFKDWKWALLGMIFLLLFPRLFAHSFFNIKDGVLAGLVMWSLYTMVRFLDRPSWGWAVAHGVTTALAIDIRIVAVVLPALTLGWWLVRLFSEKEYGLRNWALPALYLVATVIVGVAGWPYLWEDPLGHLVEAYRVMGDYQWGGEVLLWGKFYYPMGNMPWFYLPSWMLITIPVGIFLFFLAGAALIIKQLIKPLLKFNFEWYRDPKLRTDAILLSMVLGPALLVILKGSVLYDDWRQLYFLYPPLAAVALSGVERLQAQDKWRIWVRVLAGLTVVVGIVQLVRFHPVQHVYFNALAGTSREYRFDQDYWGLAYKQAFEELARRDTSAIITFYCQNYPGTANHAFLPPELEARFEQVWVEKGAEYYLSNFRERRELNLFRRKAFPFIDLVFFVRAGTTPVIGVYRTGPYWDRVTGDKGAWQLQE